MRRFASEFSKGIKPHKVLFSVLVVLLPIQVGRHFWPEWSYVLGLKIDYLSPIVYLTDLIVGGVLGLWGVEEILKTKNQKLKTHIKNLKNFFFPFSIFFFLLINALFAKNSGAALYKFVKIIEFTLLGLYVAKNRYQLSTISYQLSFAVIYSSLIAIAQFLKQASLGGIFWWLGERTFNSFTPGIAKAVINGRLIMRPYATFPHPNVLAGFLLISLIFLSNWKLETGNWKLLKWVAIALGIIAITLSFSRSAWLVGLVVFLLILLRHLRGVLRVRPWLHLGGGILVAILAALLLFRLPFSTEEAVSQRLQLIKVGINMIREQPLIGVGLNNFISQLPKFWQNLGFIYWLQPVHNIFLLVAAETGLLGLAIFLWVLILAFKQLSINNYQLTIALSTILALGLFDHYWLTLQQSQLLFTIVLGLSWGTKGG